MKFVNSSSTIVTALLSVATSFSAVTAHAELSVGNRNAICEARIEASRLGGITSRMLIDYDANGSVLLTFDTRSGYHCESAGANLQCTNGTTGDQIHTTLIFNYPSLNEGTYNPCSGRAR